MIFKYGEKVFGSRRELIRFVKTNKQFEINRKKSERKFTEAVKNFDIARLGKRIKSANNSTLDVEYNDNVASGELTRTIIANTYLWMDQSSDVLLPGVFLNSIEQRGIAIPPCSEHKYNLDNQIGVTKSINEVEVPWSMLGIDKPGNTTCLVPVAIIQQKRNPTSALRFNDYLNKYIDQHSVALVYVQLFFACDDEEDLYGYPLYKKWIDKLGNQAEVEEQGYFFACVEAKLIEYSCVIEGCNEITPVLYPLGEQSNPGTNEPQKALFRDEITKLFERIKSISKN